MISKSKYILIFLFIYSFDRGSLLEQMIIRMNLIESIIRVWRIYHPFSVWAVSLHGLLTLNDFFGDGNTCSVLFLLEKDEVHGPRY